MASGFMHIKPVKLVMEGFLRRPPSNSGNDYSVTELLQPPRITQLRKRHAKELFARPVTDEEIRKSLKAFMGTAIHSAFERNLYQAANQNPKLGLLVEKKLWEPILDRKIVGKLDIYMPGVVYDLKTTSVWKYILGGTEEYAEQLNLYAYLLRKINLPVNMLRIILFFTDFMDRDVGVKQGYPGDRIVEVKINDLWTPEVQQQKVEAMVQKHIDAEKLSDDQLPDCTQEEIWAQPTKYAVKWSGGKKALKVCETQAEARACALSKKDSNGNCPDIEVRQGKLTRCEDYCDLHEWCPQWKIFQAARNANDPTEE